MLRNQIHICFFELSLRTANSETKYSDGKNLYVILLVVEII